MCECVTGAALSWHCKHWENICVGRVCVSTLTVGMLWLIQDTKQEQRAVCPDHSTELSAHHSVLIQIKHTPQLVLVETLAGTPTPLRANGTTNSSPKTVTLLVHCEL